MSANDIVTDLENVRCNPARVGTADSDVKVFNLDYIISGRVLTRAISEIKHLRSLAGAVSDGPSFTEITKGLPRRSHEDASTDARKNG